MDWWTFKGKMLKYKWVLCMAPDDFFSSLSIWKKKGKYSKCIAVFDCDTEQLKISRFYWES